jgi:hypothetical protein
MMVLKKKLNSCIEKKRAKFLDWISDIPFPEHHLDIRQDRLQNSGQWLMQKEAYKNWRNDTFGSILWLHGIRKCAIVSLQWQEISDIYPCSWLG